MICLLERLIVNSIKLYKQKKGIKMKKFLGALIMLMMPSSIFGLAGFGIQLGQDFSKLGE